MLVFKFWFLSVVLKCWFLKITKKRQGMIFIGLSLLQATKSFYNYIYLVIPKRGAPMLKAQATRGFGGHAHV